MSLPFISNADLENYLGLTTDVDKAAIAADTACDVIRKTLDQNMDFVADDEVVLDSEGLDFLLLPEMPVYSVTSLTGPGGSELTQGTTFVLDKESGSLRTKNFGSKFLKGRQIYTAVYTHGYVSDAAAPGLPADVVEWPSSMRMVALQLASRIYDQGIVSSESVGGVSMSYAAPESIVLTDRERSMLERAVGVGRRR